MTLGSFPGLGAAHSLSSGGSTPWWAHPYAVAAGGAPGAPGAGGPPTFNVLDTFHVLHVSQPLRMDPAFKRVYGNVYVGACVVLLATPLNH